MTRYNALLLVMGLLIGANGAFAQENLNLSEPGRLFLPQAKTRTEALRGGQPERHRDLYGKRSLLLTRYAVGPSEVRRQ